MTIDLYYYPTSPPSRSVILLAKHIGVHLNLKFVDITKGEQLKGSFRKINPQHTVPTINDNGFILCESRSIMAYLVMKYAKNDSLYPRDPKKRGIVENRLQYDLGTFSKNILEYYYITIFCEKSLSIKHLLPLERVFGTLDKYLEGNKFSAGNDLTIADFSFLTTVCAAKAFGFDIGRYENVTAWYQRCEKIMDNNSIKEFFLITSNLPKLIKDNNLKN